MKGVCRTNQLKRSLIVSAILYEYYGWTLISDAEWDKRAYELVDRIKAGKDTTLFKKEFRNWGGETAFKLIKNKWGHGLAHYMDLNRDRFEI